MRGVRTGDMMGRLPRDSGGVTRRRTERQAVCWRADMAVAER